MRTAVDTSVLLAVFQGEPGAEAWLEILIRARREGQLVICDVVFAEVSPAFLDLADLTGGLGRLGISFDPVSREAAYRAGTIFRAYRGAGGRREHLIPDFLIGAHALVQADRLAAVDRGYLRRHFSELILLQP